MQAICVCHKPDIHCPVAVSHDLFWIVVREVAFTKLENAGDKNHLNQGFGSALIKCGSGYGSDIFSNCGTGSRV